MLADNAGDQQGCDLYPNHQNKTMINSALTYLFILKTMQHRRIGNLELLEILNNNGHPCDLRTVQRYMCTLAKADLITRCDNSNPTSWRIKKDGEFADVIPLLDNMKV